MLNKYLLELFGSKREKEEKIDLKKNRTSKPYVWLYHTTPLKNYENIKKIGLDPSFMGSTTGSPVEHPSGKKALSFSSFKAYSMLWSGFGRGLTLLVKVPTKDLFFTIRDGNIDEYQNIHKIPPRDIVFPNSPIYQKIEKTYTYLNPSEKANY